MAELGLCALGATELAARIRRREVSPVELVDQALRRIDEVNPTLNAFCLVLADEARDAARRAEAAVMRGDWLGPLHGVPVSIKDLILTRRARTCFGSKLHENLVPEHDAPAVARLRTAGAIVLGKTTTPEFGYKAITESRLHGVTRNPWNPALTPGGSSGGAAVAVASGMGPLALGSDGGGSIRVPASYCGIVGLKPSFGRVPLSPLAGWESLDYRLEHQGPLARTVADAALMLDAMAGPDEGDPTSLPAMPAAYSSALRDGVRGSRVAWSPGFNGAVAEPEVLALAAAAARGFAELGCEVEEVTPAFPPLHDLFRCLFAAECAGALGERLDAWRGQMDPGLVRLVEIGLGISAAEYARAKNEVSRSVRAILALSERYDLLLTPTTPLPPFPVGRDWPREIAGQKVHPLAFLAYTYPFNLTGQPGASVPCGWTEAGLPVGLQIVGRRFDELMVLRAAAAFEEAFPWAHRRPSI
jgi:Asp-tRNA(Asn)/Glu-tRNA(Gln) amidotransferase A subunit family amidase